ncbi:MAG: hypothetical protein ACPGAO_05205 [Flavobacteriaceae bacterium]
MKSTDSNPHNRELLTLGLLLFITGCIAKIPFIIDYPEDSFYAHFMGVILVPTWSYYIALKRKNTLIYPLISSLFAVIIAFFLKYFFGFSEGDSFGIALIHSVVIFLFCIGFAFLGANWNETKERMRYLKFLIDTAVVSGLLLISSVVFSGITIELFTLTALDIEGFYIENVVVWGLPAIPIIASYLVLNNPDLVEKVTPLLSKIFSPLAFLALVLFSIALVFAPNNIFEDRELLLLFNLILIAVCALILFSVSDKNLNQRQWKIIRLLSYITTLDNLIALLAIGYRIFENGVTPNRFTLIGINLMLFIQLLLLNKQLYHAFSQKSIKNAVKIVSGPYLNIYLLWSIAILFIVIPFWF